MRGTMGVGRDVVDVFAIGPLIMPLVIDVPAPPTDRPRTRTARVAVVRTRPETVIEDYGRVMHLAGYSDVLMRDRDTLLKLNLSWTKYFPSCSSQPWQVDGVIATMLRDGFERRRLIPIENRTVVTDPRKGCRNNRWEGVLDQFGLTFTPLPEVEWRVYPFKSPLLKLNEIFPEGIQIPAIYPGKQILHMPTVKTHGHAVMTGSVKNSFGGLLREVRHYAHKYMHEVLVDLLYMQRELHPAVFTVMDGTVAGDGAGPRTMIPRVKNLILAAADSVAIDAIAARLMGFDPMSIPFLRMAHERGLGIADPRDIELTGDDVSQENFGFETRRSLVIWGDQMIRKGFLRPLERLLLHSPLMVWALCVERLPRRILVSDNRPVAHPVLHAHGVGRPFQKVLNRWIKIRKGAEDTFIAAGAVPIGAGSSDEHSRNRCREAETKSTSSRSCGIFAPASRSVRASICPISRFRIWRRDAWNPSLTLAPSGRRCWKGCAAALEP